ncbi:uncharacterized protein VDAG_10289 [Verticillium dahliae VdLs.17]|uniref:Putative gamma-glutamylcyclotransferase n=1 Tax=Verticillium dahliae (strain VdLs.17 / ATCC MYA-4575 / FGSC 10137) TaxID=498257 RepID=G2XJM6_VERDV|nr:uncharacterized protein VDAG_10289 [Verticillium dahliae VdLs.17]EGY20729.1 hypothetical protein VDAG_10289 [Verticillium dahliae VdLs.17]KAH6708105.1 hypothetical protein EV126DRAFT_104676 [Verticillium dahliae]
MIDRFGADASARGSGPAGAIGDKLSTTWPTVSTPRLQEPQEPHMNPGDSASGNLPRQLTDYASQATDSSLETALFPFHVFLYGPLMDTDVLQAVVGIARRPTLHPGYIRGWRVRMYGTHPAIVPQMTLGRGGDVVVAGMVWECRSPKQLARLQEYETEAYILCSCEVILKGEGTALKNSEVFCWAGHADSEELTDGWFDLGWYRGAHEACVCVRLDTCDMSTTRGRAMDLPGFGWPLDRYDVRETSNATCSMRCGSPTLRGCDGLTFIAVLVGRLKLVPFENRH